MKRVEIEDETFESLMEYGMDAETAIRIALRRKRGTAGLEEYFEHGNAD
ncbi:hypothetical protein GCM10007108_06960 [Thermogymnomonas acidicola]|uniref:Uncharacterized protein n=1 Tax=Thermogymnomonas acidicola TaxID=399579 RepID=A0AA37BQV0_9ARCH|nr:hypothetical protein [Thermogymnomonas acidicola]GGM71444.1 hypothetical protein GCM10007108_06960 [Thermogymnomonas acidicola]